MQFQLQEVYNIAIKRTNYTSILEEIINAVSHGFGFILGIAGLPILLIFAVKNGSFEKTLGLAVFSVTLILMYLASTLFHSLSYTRANKIFRIFDHSAIFLFIAGTYTPFALVTLVGSLGLVLLITIWISAVCGIVFKIFYINKIKLSLVLYLLMGWFGAVVVSKPLISNLPVHGFKILLLGGLFYSCGIVFYIWKKLRFHHSLWHLCVLGGSVCHFTAMFYI